MAHTEPRIVIVPGWRNSGPDHWQSLWAHSLPQAERVEQDDWLTPKRADWVQALTTPARKRTGSQNAKPGSRPIAAVSAMVASRPPRTMRVSSIRIAAQLSAPTK